MGMLKKKQPPGCPKPVYYHREVFREKINPRGPRQKARVRAITCPEEGHVSRYSRYALAGGQGKATAERCAPQAVRPCLRRLMNL